MCGFVVHLSSSSLLGEEAMRAALALIRHRGPDSQALAAVNGCEMGFARLSIVDTSSGSNQPFADPGRRTTMVFNGEIYNYLGLRRELERAGRVFKTNGEVEVLLAAWERWGKGMFPRLEGMFAIVIYDAVERTLTAARDPLGIKPLYWCEDKRGLLLASEVRPIRKIVDACVDPDALRELILFRFSGGERSNYLNIHLLPGGCILEAREGGTRHALSTFASLADTWSPTRLVELPEAIDEARDMVRRSVESHLQSDVGFALQLSGGIDSSLVAAIAQQYSGQRLQSFAVNLGDLPQDESEYRQEVVETYGLDHHEVRLTMEDFAEEFPTAIAAMEGPTPHFGCVMLKLLCKEIAKSHKVVLTGEGADELFGGYMRYQQWPLLIRYSRAARILPSAAWGSPLLRRYGSIRRYKGRDPAVYASAAVDPEVFGRMFPALSQADDQRSRVASGHTSLRDRMMAVDQSFYLGSLLMRQDKMAMAHSLEARVPFAHFPLFQSMNRIPRRLRVPGGCTKPILKAIASDWFSRDFVHRRKVGLNLPLVEWCRESNGLGRYLGLLTDSHAHLAAYARPSSMRSIVDRFLSREASETECQAIPHLINLEIWLRSVGSSYFN